MDRPSMYPLMYWNVWRRSYHEARTVYHKSMQEFYDGQLKMQEEWSKMLMKTIDNGINLVAMRYLQYILPTNNPLTASIGRGFGFNPSSSSSSSSWFGVEEKEKGK